MRNSIISTAQHSTAHKDGLVSGLLEYRTMIGSVCIITRNGDNMNDLFCLKKDCKKMSGDAYG